MVTSSLSLTGQGVAGSKLSGISFEPVQICELLEGHVSDHVAGEEDEIRPQQLRHPPQRISRAGALRDGDHLERELPAIRV